MRPRPPWSSHCWRSARLKVHIVTRDLPAVTQEISAQLAETTQLLKPGVLLETLSDLEVRWGKLGEQLGPLDPRPNEPRQLDRQADRAPP